MNQSKVFPISKKGVLMLSVAMAVHSAGAQEATETGDNVEVIQVTGISASLQKSTAMKRDASGILDAISAEDIGKFPDTNLAESLQRITGVSISRNGGEGNSVTVRGFGPQFNAVTLNGRTMPNTNTGRGFRFDTLAAEMVGGVEVYKSASAAVQSGGIGSTINIITPKPLRMGDNASLSVKALNDIDAGDTTPAMSGLISRSLTDKLAVLGAISYQKRKTQTDYSEVMRWNNREEIVKARGWGGPRLEFQNGDVPVNFYPTQHVQGRREQNRERVNASAVIQYQPTDSLTATLDANYSDLKISGNDVESAFWFGNNYATPASANASETLTSLELPAIGLDMFMRAPESRHVSLQTGLNLEWFVSDYQTLVFDASSAKAERNPNRELNVNASDIQAIPIDLLFDTRNGVVSHLYDAADVSLGNAKIHQQDAYSNNTVDDIDQFRLDYTYDGDSASFKAGVMFTDQTKFVRSFNTNKGPEGSEEGRAYSFRGKYNLVGDNENGSGVFDTIAEAEAAGYDIRTIDHEYAGEVAFIYFDPNAVYSWIPTLQQDPNFVGLDLVEQNDWYEINETTIAAYAEITTEVELAGRPLTLVAGTRVENTAIDSTSLETTLTSLSVVESGSTVAENMLKTFGPASPYTDGDDYDVFLPNMSIKYELSDDIVLRFASSRTITRPELANMRSARTFGDIRDDGASGLGSSGNPDLKPYISDNLDLSAEWYIDDLSYVSFGLFHKKVDNFIVEYAEPETIEGVINPVTGEDAVYDITRPQNQDTKKVRGAEVAVQYAFGESGFGTIVNATWVDTDSPFETDQTDSSAVLGLSDSANFIAYFEKYGFQARIAYNWREAFVEQFGHNYSTTTGEPTQVDDYGQIDISASYDVNENLTVFLEGINVLGEETYKYSRYQDQFVRAQTNSPRYAVGVRSKF